MSKNQVIQINSEYERIKFTFPVLEKFIIMDLNNKIALEDLKFTFTNILKVDLFAKKLSFLIKKGFLQIELNSQQSLKGQIALENYKKEQAHIEVIVKFFEEGA
ncbi:unnamed protein product [Paramecium pentaurelia]|uniref:Uncharacterized protein n=1 Tax=Paramecium pentaurelia TaxID=43138 RepID=A0A8S1YMU2_9CILI|nr:unnamed protein product [Paramecium pentaurelia]